MEAGSRRAPDFGALAADYDRLRPVDERWREVLDLLVAEGDLLGRRVLDVGCGTGQVAAALQDRARVWGVDPSEEMLERARAAAPGAGFKQGRAESLPFKDAWFERVVFRLALHLVDRARALTEARRVLAPKGRLAVATFAPEHFDTYWLSGFFPAVLTIDRARFPTARQLEDELERAGFAGVRTTPLRQHAHLTRAAALERIRRRYISTLRLLDEDEFTAGLRRAEQELGDSVDYTVDWLVLVGDRT